MGEMHPDLFSASDTAIRPTFNGAVRVEARDEKLTGDAGALLSREIMERISLTDWLEERLFDPRNPELVTHPLPELLRTQLSLLVQACLCVARRQGWTDADDADALRDDPALRIAVSDRKQDASLRTPEEAHVPDGLASQPTLSRQLAALSHDTNDPVLQEANLFLIHQRCCWAGPRKRYEHLTLDMDSIPVKVHGHQKGSAYNGHYHQRCYRPHGPAVIHEGPCADHLPRAQSLVLDQRQGRRTVAATMDPSRPPGLRPGGSVT